MYEFYACKWETVINYSRTLTASLLKKPPKFDVFAHAAKKSYKEQSNENESRPLNAMSGREILSLW